MLAAVDVGADCFARPENGGIIDRRLGSMMNELAVGCAQQILSAAVLAHADSDLANQIVAQSPSDYNIGHAHPQGHARPQWSL